MELLLIRHGLPIRREVECGAADPDLSEVGRQQADLLGSYLANEPIDAAYASPMRRAHQTALPVASAHSLDLVLEPDVAEFDRASNEYVPVEELKATGDPRWEQMLAGTYDPGSDEERDEFEERAIDAVERIIAAHRGGTAVVVCHGGVISTYLAHILEIPRPEGSFNPGFFYPGYTSIHRVAASSRGHRSVLAINETAHLRGSGLPIGMGRHG